MQEKRIFENCDDYTVTDDGRVFSYKSGKRKELSQAGVSRNKKYKVVNFWIKGKNKSFYVHRLVAEAFIPNPNKLPEINHKDRNPSNNYVNNLEWVTASDNMLHKYSTDEYKECLICKKRIWVKKGNLCSDCKENIIGKIDRILLHQLNNKYQENSDTNEKKTDRQKQVLTLIAKGYSQSDMARELQISKQRISRLVKSCFL